jgi:cold shock CspA family protein
MLEVGADVKGVVVRWIDDAGKPYGFARVRGAEEDLFLPSSKLRNAVALRVGDRVRAEVRMDYQHRLYADNIELVDDGPEAA